MDMDGELSAKYWNCFDGRVVAGEHPVGALRGEPDVALAAGEVGDRELADRAFHAGEGSGRLPRSCPEVRVVHELAAGVQLRPPLPQDRVALRVEALDEVVEHTADPSRRSG